MLASFLLPTRKRFPKLMRAVMSIRDTASEKDNYEICLRVHSDDGLTIDRLNEILGIGNVRVHIGPPLAYAHNVSAFDEACRIATGSWIAFFNDDCVMEGHGWDSQLLNLPERTIAIPETHRLGKSTYLRDRHIPFFFMPAYSWGTRNFPSGGDAGLWDFYEKQGWNVHWLSGIAVWHDRSDTECAKIKDL